MTGPTLQALDSTQPGLPLNNRRRGTITHDFEGFFAELQ
jgi:hypothetical protein